MMGSPGGTRWEQNTLQVRRNVSGDLSQRRLTPFAASAHSACQRPSAPPYRDAKNGIGRESNQRAGSRPSIARADAKSLAGQELRRPQKIAVSTQEVARARICSANARKLGTRIAGIIATIGLRCRR